MIFLPIIENKISQHIAVIFFLIPLYLSIDSAKELRRFFIEQQNLFDGKEKNNKTDHLATIQSVAFLTFFLWASALSKAYLSFTISIFSTMVLFFTVAAFIFYLSLKISNPKSSDLLFYSILAGFIIAELFWALSFSPLGHFSISAVLLIIFWFWRDILQRHFENKLSRKIILQNIIFGAVGLGLIFLSAKWLPIWFYSPKLSFWIHFRIYRLFKKLLFYRIILKILKQVQDDRLFTAWKLIENWKLKIFLSSSRQN